MLAPEDKELVKADFSAWMEVMDRKAELSKELKALAEHSAPLLETKTAKVTKLFKIMKKKFDSAEDELQEMSDLLEEVTD